MEHERSETLVLDFMDSLLQLLLAMEWQRERSDGLTQLRKLSTAIDTQLDINEAEFQQPYSRSEAKFWILRRLQAASRVRVPISPWTQQPNREDLQKLHTERLAVLTAAVVGALLTLRDQAKHFERPEKVDRVVYATHRLSDQYGIPLHIPGFVGMIFRLHDGHHRDLQEAVGAELRRYVIETEKIAGDRRAMTCERIASGLLHTARKVHLEIDQSFSWETLIYFGKESPLKALSTYAMLNQLGYVSDAHFSIDNSRRLSTRIAAVRPLMTPHLIRGMTLMMQPNDRSTRRLREMVLDTNEHQVTVDGHLLQDRFVMALPKDIENPDLQRVLAILLVQIASTRRRGRSPSSGGIPDFTSGFSENLRSIVEEHRFERKLFRTKKRILQCICGLAAEVIYQRRHDLKPVSFNWRRPLATRQDADDFTSEMIRRRGFTYGAETLRRNRSKFRQEFLLRVPELLEH